MAEEVLHYMVLGTDAEGMQALRQQLRPLHRAWLRQHPGHNVTVVHGGPTLDDAGIMNGTLLVIAAPGKEAVQAFLAADPYVRSGLFRMLQVRRWSWSLGCQAAGHTAHEGHAIP